MAKKTLQQFVESTKHSFIARIIVASNKIVTKQTEDDVDFIACVEKKYNPECLSLSRRGRDSLTAIIVYDVWDQKETLSYFKKENKEVPDELKVILEDNKDAYCFCRCNVKNRKAEIRGPSR